MLLAYLVCVVSLSLSLKDLLGPVTRVKKKSVWCEYRGGTSWRKREGGSVSGTAPASAFRVERLGFTGVPRS